jgi:YHS domain-containing protein
MSTNHVTKLAGLLRTLVVAAPLLTLGAPAGHAAADLVNTGYFGNVAINGYDPVAYFTDGKAIKGTPEFSKNWLGATWYFASVAHRDVFAADPIRYAPQYGGFCAMGTSLEEASANIDPEAWRIVDGKLYLFTGKEGLSEDFDGGATSVITKADSNWPIIKVKELTARMDDR